MPDHSEHAADAMVLQSVVVDKSIASSIDEAIGHAKHFGKASRSGVDETGDSYRFRQRDPSDFVPNSMRTIKPRAGISLVVGHLTATASATTAKRRLYAVELRALKFDDPSEAGAPVTSWIQVARLGDYKGHPAGAFAFTPAVFAQMIANFASTDNQRVPLDFEHASEMVDGSVMQQGAPATGWITQLAVRGDGLWGLVEWLEPGLSYVREGRYRFFSPAVVFDSVDPVTGEDRGPVLVSGALTNRPFLDGMAPVTARLGLDPASVHVDGPMAIPPRNPNAGESGAATDEPKGPKSMADAEQNQDNRVGGMNAVHARMRRMGLAAAMPGADIEGEIHDAINELEEIVKEVPAGDGATHAERMRNMVHGYRQFEADAKQRAMDAAAADVDDAVPAPMRASTDARDALIRFRLTDPKGFAAVHPKRKDAPPSSKLPADALALLTNRVGPNPSRTPAETPAPLDGAPALLSLSAAELSAVQVEMAEKIMQTDKVDYKTASERAAVRLRDARQNEALGGAR